MSLTWVEASMALLICAFGHDFQKPSHWVTKYAHLDNAWLPDPNEWKYGILLAAEEVWEPGYWAMRQVVRAKSFTCFTLHRLVRFCWLVLVCWGGLCLLCVVWFGSLTNLCDRVINRWLFSITPWLPLLLQRAQLSPKKKSPEALFALFRQRCLDYAIFWTWCCRNWRQYVLRGLMLLGLYGPATTFEPSLMKMDIRSSRRLQLHTSTRLMTISITCESCGVPYRSSCFLIPAWCILWMYISSKAKLCIDWTSSTSNWVWGKVWPCLCTTESRVEPM